MLAKASPKPELDGRRPRLRYRGWPVIQWDYADRLRHADKLGGGDVYYTYDAAGQRVRKVYVHGSTIEERVYLDGYEVYRKHTGLQIDPEEDPEEERQTLHVMDDQRRVALVETKTWEDDVEVGTPVSRWLYQLENHLGSSSMELDHIGAVVSYEEYHPYGTTAFHTLRGGAEVSAKRYRYTGKERDEETGLYYHGARYYAPWLGRWTAADPAGVVDGVNLYRYSRDNPVLLTDPGGTLSKENQEFLARARQVSFTPFADKSDRPHFFFALPKDFKGRGGFVGVLTDEYLDELRAAGATPFSFIPEGDASESSALEDAVEGAAVQARESAKDAVERAKLQEEIKQLKEQQLKKAGQRPEPDVKLREEAVNERNKATLRTREKLSDLGRGASEAQKPSNKLPTSEQEVQKRTAQVDEAVRKGERKPFPSEAQRQRAITEEVIKGGGRGNAGVNKGARFFRGVGRGLFALGVGLAILEVARAPEGDKVRTATREALTMAAGAAAAAAVGVAATSLAAAGVISAPALAVVALGFAVGMGVAIGVSMLFDRLVPAKL